MVPNPETLLLIERNYGAAERLKALLAKAGSQAFNVIWERSVPSAVERIKRGLHPEIIILDLDFPEQDKRMICQDLNEVARHVPLLLISPENERSAALQVSRLGAQDYLVKDQFDGPLLLRTLRYAISRKNMEQSLAREEEVLNSLLANSPDRIYFKDDRSRFLRINSALAEFFGLDDPKKAVGMTDFDFFDRSHAEAAMADEKAILENGEPIIGKTEKEVRRDGQVSWASTTKMPLRDRHGKIVGTMGVSRDISDLKYTEEALLTERILLRTILDALPDNVFVKDEEGCYFETNPAHTADLGASDPDEVIGKSAYDFFDQETAQDYHQNDLKVLESGEAVINREEKRQDKQGQTRWVLTSKVPFHSPETGHRGLVGISRDITAQKKAETQLRDAIQSLQEMQLQLIEAEKFKSVARLTAGVAHEIKNPIGVVLMGLEYLGKHLSDQENPKIKELLADMENAAQRANQFIGELLSFSAPEDANLEPVDVNETIRQALLLIRPQVQGKSIEIKESLTEDLPKIRGLGKKMEQVWVNLLVNAVQAIDHEGTIEIKTSVDHIKASKDNLGEDIAEAFRTGDRVIRVTISDTGPGIPEENLKKIFEAFFTTKKDSQGTGLGLTVSKNIVDLHSGLLSIKNHSEGGAIAEVWLPTERKHEK